MYWDEWVSKDARDRGYEISNELGSADGLGDVQRYVLHADEIVTGGQALGDGEGDLREA